MSISFLHEFGEPVEGGRWWIASVAYHAWLHVMLVKTDKQRKLGKYLVYDSKFGLVGKAHAINWSCISFINIQYWSHPSIRDLHITAYSWAIFWMVSSYTTHFGSCFTGNSLFARLGYRNIEVGSRCLLKTVRLWEPSFSYLGVISCFIHILRANYTIIFVLIVLGPKVFDFWLECTCLRGMFENV